MSHFLKESKSQYPRKKLFRCFFKSPLPTSLTFPIPSPVNLLPHTCPSPGPSAPFFRIRSAITDVATKGGADAGRLGNCELLDVAVLKFKASPLIKSGLSVSLPSVSIVGFSPGDVAFFRR